MLAGRELSSAVHLTDGARNALQMGDETGSGRPSDSQDRCANLVESGFFKA